MATEPGWFYEWFANNWFPPVWFAPSDDEDVPLAERRPTGGGTDSHVPRVNLLELHRLTKERNEEAARLEAERIARDELQAAEIVFRLRRNDPVSPEPVVTDAPTVKDSLSVAANDDAANLDAATDSASRKISVSFSALNGLVQETPISIQVADDVQSKAAFSDDDALALIMILAEID